LEITKTMRIVLLGAPGSGKGTQATFLKDRLGIAHVSTGDLLRQAVADGTALGLQAKAVMEAGRLVSDDLVLGMLEDRLSRGDVGSGFILDGYPRNLVQATALDGLLRKIAQPLDRAILIDVPVTLLVERLAGRAQAEGRADDTPETVRNRLDVYNQQTAPVLDFYAQRGELLKVDGVGSLETVLARMLAVAT